MPSPCVAWDPLKRESLLGDSQVIDALTAPSMVNTVAVAVAGVDTPWTRSSPGDQTQPPVLMGHGLWDEDHAVDEEVRVDF